MKRIIIHVLMVIVGATVGDAFLPEFWVLINQRQFQNNIVSNFVFDILNSEVKQNFSMRQLWNT